MHNLLDKHFKNEQDLRYIHYWLAKAYEVDPNSWAIKYNNFYPLSDETLVSAAQFLTQKGSDANLPYLVLANRNFEKSDTALAMSYYRKIDFETINRSSDRFEYLEKTFFLNQVKDLSRNMAGVGRDDEAIRLINTFTANHEKAISYLFNAERQYANDHNPQAFVSLDSALTKMKNDDFNAMREELDYRFKMVTVLGQIGGEKLKGLSKSIVQDFFEGDKLEGVISLVRGIASEGNYYEAVSAMPPTLTETEELIGYYNLLWEACKSKEARKPLPEWAAMNQYFNWNQEYFFYVPF
jgi:hypothetical protein